MPLVGATAMRQFLGWMPADDHHRNGVFVAQFLVPDQGSVQACVKMYPHEQGRNRGLVNEITGYLFGHALGIPQPDLAFVAHVPIKHINGAKGLVRELKRAKVDTYPAFCTRRIDGHSAAVRVPDSQLPAVVEDIRKWRALPHAVALDENIANSDRHLNNLLRLGTGDYAVIDNGLLACPYPGGNWSAEDLDAQGNYVNVLSENMWQNNPPGRMVSKMLDLSRHHLSAVAGIANELEFWWSKLLSEDDHQAFKAFLDARTANVHSLLANRYGRLL
ncbi:MAG: hypothetical protein JJU06_05900 [Ectothiorhodospiraceae bacterium]|nr:hypothetical protein [Ectothiorhodospiraceae bacterium]MCH8506764.1 hypothetical protein [Ectothiorhodospiraceae bacterium]